MTITDVLLLLIAMGVFMLIRSLEKIEDTSNSILKELKYNNDLAKSSDATISGMEILLCGISPAGKICPDTICEEVEEPEMTMGEAYAVIMETLVACMEDIQEKEATNETIKAFTEDLNLMKSYADEIFERLEASDTRVTEEAVRALIVADLKESNLK